MKTLSVALLSVMFAMPAARAEVEDTSDCSSKYQRPILVRSSDGTFSRLSVNTRSSFCSVGLEDVAFLREGGPDGDSVDTGDGKGEGECEGEGGEHGGGNDPK